MKTELDLFGNNVPIDVLLRDKFMEPPFSVLDTRQGSWQSRKRKWLELGIKSELGRNAPAIHLDSDKVNIDKDAEYTSVFDPALTELMYLWFCPEGGFILDPFAGGSVRGVVAAYLGYHYTGIELRDEQVQSNIEQAVTIKLPYAPLWLCGDSDVWLDDLKGKYDFIFSCPPYADLEVYSDLPDDLSTMDYSTFLAKYESIIRKALALLKVGSYAVFVVGEVRDSEGYYYDFVGDTKRLFAKHGARLYNDAILLNSVGSASMRTKQFEVSKKLVKIHQNVVCFKKL